MTVRFRMPTVILMTCNSSAEVYVFDISSCNPLAKFIVKKGFRLPHFFISARISVRAAL